MMRFYELDAARITLDGVDGTAMTRYEFRSWIGMVLWGVIPAVTAASKAL